MHKRRPKVALPCLRCGTSAVLVSFLFPLNSRDVISCRRCDAKHYLSVRREAWGLHVCYHLYTLRYPLDQYDQDFDPPVVRLKTSSHAADVDSAVIFSGPITIYPRKKRFSPSEVQAIWRASKGRCHICGRSWRLRDRSVRGWHIDHVIPHIGGGEEVERLLNLRVACARCNLKKGKGFTEKSIRLALRQLAELFEVQPSEGR